MSIDSIAFTSLIATASLLGLGCATHSSQASTQGTLPDAAVMTVTPEGTTLATLRVEPAYAYGFDYDDDGSYAAMYDFEADPEYSPTESTQRYPYGYDYDGDGSYVAMHTFSTPRWNPDESSWKYPYSFDHDDDGSYAAPRPSAEPEPLSSTTVTRVKIMPLMVDAALASACMAAEPTVYFAYDSDELSEGVERDIDALARCLRADTMSNATIEIVGHADMRGPDEYNQDLGRDRAEEVAAALRERGLSADRMQVISKGERAAEAPEHWDDRRVVVRLK